jgi:hypothetical protein
MPNVKLKCDLKTRVFDKQGYFTGILGDAIIKLIWTLALAGVRLIV